MLREGFPGEVDKVNALVEFLALLVGAIVGVVLLQGWGVVQ